MEENVIVIIEELGKKNTLTVPNNMGLSLMEVLKGEEYDFIEGTCGGMALCATCHVKVEECLPELAEQHESELMMLETLPVIYSNSRLACQIKLNENIKKIKIRIPEN